MKKNALIIILFLGSLNFSIAQESSPTKEVTVQSINKYMNEAVGMKIYGLRRDDNGNFTLRNGYIRIESHTLSLDKIDIRYSHSSFDNDGNYEGSYTSHQQYSQLNWDNFTIKIDSSEILKRDSSVALITLYPTSMAKWENECFPGTYNVVCTQTEYYDSFSFYIPKNRVTSCHKALLHLKELMKEEDPFGN
jgi:hypothetical protein